MVSFLITFWFNFLCNLFYFIIYSFISYLGTYRILFNFISSFSTLIQFFISIGLCHNYSSSYSSLPDVTYCSYGCHFARVFCVGVNHETLWEISGHFVQKDYVSDEAWTKINTSSILGLQVYLSLLRMYLSPPDVHCLGPIKMELSGPQANLQAALQVLELHHSKLNTTKVKSSRWSTPFLTRGGLRTNPDLVILISNSTFFFLECNVCLLHWNRSSCSHIE